MKFNWNLHNPHFEVSESERLEIINYKKELLTELDNHGEYEKEELIAEIENIYNIPTILEILEKERLETKNYRAFCTEYYKENCFFIDENGLAKITDNEQLFYRFYHAFTQKSKFNARAIAGNIIKVRLIEYIARIIATNKRDQILLPPIELQEQYPDKIFKDYNSYQNFQYWIKEYQKDKSNKVNRRFVSALYYCSQSLLECTQYEFVKFWNKNYTTPKLRYNDEDKKGRLDSHSDVENYISTIEKLK